MTQSDWLRCQDPQAMLEWLRTSGKLSERKLRLFAVACCRRIWPRLTPESSRAVETAERYADGLARAKELPEPWPSEEAIRKHQFPPHYDSSGADWGTYKATFCAYEAAAGAAARETDWMRSVPYYAAGAVAWEQVGAARSASVAAEWAAAWSAVEQNEFDKQACVLRDIVGNPFRLMRFDPTWRSPEVVTLAGHIEYDRDFARMPELASALEEAGCTDAELLGHLRAPGPHWRGCFALDAVRGKN
jgi:hypothetical protein